MITYMVKFSESWWSLVYHGGHDVIPEALNVGNSLLREKTLRVTEHDIQLTWLGLRLGYSGILVCTCCHDLSHVPFVVVLPGTNDGFADPYPLRGIGDRAPTSTCAGGILVQ